MSFRCGIDQGGKATAGSKSKDLSCGSVCGRKLACGKHMCETMCHEGPCKGCDVREMAKCYCGSVQKEIGCGEGEQVTCIDGGADNNWIGRFQCRSLCQKYVLFLPIRTKRRYNIFHRGSTIVTSTDAISPAIRHINQHCVHSRLQLSRTALVASFQSRRHPIWQHPLLQGQRPFHLARTAVLQSQLVCLLAESPKRDATILAGLRVIQGHAPPVVLF